MKNIIMSKFYIRLLCFLIFMVSIGTFHSISKVRVYAFAENERCNVVNVNQEYYINNLEDKDGYNYLHFSVPQDGRIKLMIRDCTYNKFNDDGWRLYDTNDSYRDDFYFSWEKYTSETADGPWITVFAGEYYFEQSNWYTVHFGSSNPEAYLKIVFEASDSYVGEKENNDIYDTANELLSGMVYEADRSHNDDIDVYKLVMQSAGKVSLNINNQSYSFYSEDQNQNVTELYRLTAGTSELRLPAGVFYISIKPNSNYSIKADINFEDVALYEQEFNNVSSQANVIQTNSWYTGSFNGGNYEEDIDFYKFVIDKTSDVTVQIKVPRQAPSTATIYLYDENLKQIVKDVTTSNPFLELKTKTLDEGNYFVKIVGGSELSGEYSVNVEQKEYHVLNRTSYSGQMGKSIQLELSDVDSDISWETSNKKIATVDQEGMVKIKGVGVVYITANYAGQEYQCKVEGKSNFEKGSWSDGYVSYKIAKISENKLFVNIKCGKEKYSKEFKLNSNGTKATGSFICKYGKKHKIDITYSKKTSQLSGGDKTKCSHVLW